MDRFPYPVQNEQMFVPMQEEIKKNCATCVWADEHFNNYGDVAVIYCHYGKRAVYDPTNKIDKTEGCPSWAKLETRGKR